MIDVTKRIFWRQFSSRLFLPISLFPVVSSVKRSFQSAWNLPSMCSSPSLRRLQTKTEAHTPWAKKNSKALWHPNCQTWSRLVLSTPVNINMLRMLFGLPVMLLIELEVLIDCFLCCVCSHIVSVLCKALCNEYQTSGKGEFLMLILMHALEWSHQLVILRNESVEAYLSAIGMNLYRKDGLLTCLGYFWTDLWYTYEKKNIKMIL